MKSLEKIRYLVALVLLGALAPAQNTILALTSGGNAMHINATTGAMTLLGPSGLSLVGCLAASPTTGIFYAYAGVGSGLAQYTVNPLTGIATSTGFSLPPVAFQSSALAVAPSGVGYVVAYGPPSTLFSVNLSAGAAAAYVTSWVNYNISGLAADAAGTLYGWWPAPLNNTSGTLVTINPVNGGITTIGTGMGTIQSLAFSPSGVLYGAFDQLFTIDTATGATTPISGGYGAVTGIEFMADPPQPATVSFVPGSGAVAPGGVLAVLYHAPGHGGETFAPVPSCTLGMFGAPFLPQPLGIAWDACTDFYFNAPAAHSVLPLTGSPGAVAGTLDAAGNAIGFLLPPASLPSALNIPLHITFVTWTAANVFTVGGVNTALIY